MIFGEGPIIKNIAGDLNKLFLQGSRVNQPINNVEGDAAADQATVQLMADRDPVIRDISTGLGWAGREVTVSGTGALQLVNSLGRPLKSWSVELAPFQEGSGDPSPENVRPIHGTNKIIIWTSGKNLINAANFSGNTTGSELRLIAGPVALPAATYTLSWTQTDDIVSNTRNTPAYKIGNGSYQYQIATENGNLGSGRKQWTFTLSEAGTVTFAFWTHTISPACDYINFQLEVGSGATPYVAYTQPVQTEITLPQTDYSVTIGETGGEREDTVYVLDDSLPWQTWGVNFQRQGITGFFLYRSNVTTLDFSNINVGLQTNILRIANVWGGSDIGYFTNSTNPNPNAWYEMAAINNSAAGIEDNDTNEQAIAKFKAFLITTPLQVRFGFTTSVHFSIVLPDIITAQGDGTIWVTAEDGIVTNFSATYLQSE